MDIEITKEKDRPLFSRKRITAWVYAEGATPNRTEICLALAKKIGAKPELVSIRHIYSRFGQNDTKVIAHVYKDRKTMERLESEGLLKKHKLAEAKEKPAEEAKEEKPAEETKEEKTEKKETKDKEPAEEAKEEKPAEETKEEKTEKEKADKEDPKKEAEAN